MITDAVLAQLAVYIEQAWRKNPALTEAQVAKVAVLRMRAERERTA